MAKDMLKRPNMGPLTEGFAEAWRAYKKEVSQGKTAYKVVFDESHDIGWAIGVIGIEPTGAGLGKALGVVPRQAENILKGTSGLRNHLGTLSRFLRKKKIETEKLYPRRFVSMTPPRSLSKEDAARQKEGSRAWRDIREAEGILFGNTASDRLIEEAHDELEMRALVEGAMLLDNRDRRLLIDLMCSLLARNGKSFPNLLPSSMGPEGYLDVIADIVSDENKHQSLIKEITGLSPNDVVPMNQDDEPERGKYWPHYDEATDAILGQYVDG